MRLQFHIDLPGGFIRQIEWSRRTTQIVSDHEFGSQAAIDLSERRHPDMPADVHPDVVDLCDASVSEWGDDGAASAIGLLWGIARLALACTGSTGHACLTVTRAGMTITCQTIPG